MINVEDPYVIQEITEEEAHELLSSCDNDPVECKPFGKFFVKEFHSGNMIYVAIDNEIGCAWTEEFNTKEECFKYLWGDPCVDRFGIKHCD